MTSRQAVPSVELLPACALPSLRFDHPGAPMGPGEGPVAASAAPTRSLAFDRLGACAAVLDGEGIIVDTNEAWRLFAHLNDGSPWETGVGSDYLATCDRSAVEGSAAADVVATGLRELLAGERGHFDLEYPCPSADEDRWFLMQASAASVSNGAGAVVLHIDITARKVLEEGLAARADRDGLTGLANRSSALAHLEDRLGDGTPLAVIFLDLDGFKAVNDRHGHQCGDELLVKVASRIQRQVTGEAHVSRLGGDEFVVIGGGWDADEGLRVAERIRAAVLRPFQIGAQRVSVGVSVGVAASSEASTGGLLLRSADARMYVDKQRRSTHRRRLTDLAVRLPVPNRAPLLAPDRSEDVAPDLALIAQLRSAQAMTDAVLAHSADLVIFFDQAGTIEWVSAAAMKVFGVEATSMVGRNGFDFIHPDDQERVLAAFLGIPHLGDHVLCEFRITVGDEVRWVEEMATNLLAEPNVHRIVGNIRDITERKQAADAVLLQETLLAAAGQAIVARDNHGNVLYWNDAAEVLYGWSATEAAGQSLDRLVPLAEGSEIPAGAPSGIVEPTEPWQGELCVVTKAGREVPIMVTSRPVFDATGAQVATTVVSVDITEQLQAREAAARLSAIVEFSNDAIFSAGLDGSILTWNDGASRLYGRSAEEAVGSQLTGLVAAEARDALLHGFEQIRRDGVPTTIVTIGCGVAGRRFDVAISMSPIRTAAGVLTGVSTIAQDVTERVQRRQRAEEAQRRLADAQATARLGSFEVDLESGEVERSAELWRILGLEEGALTGLSLDHIHIDDRAAVRRAYREAVAGDAEVSCTHRIVRPDGQLRWVLARWRPIRTTGSARLAGTVLDITERHEAELALAHQANHDALTGLANRRLFVEELDRSLERSAGSGGRATGVMFIDLDDFKTVNSRFGHVDGDEVLRAVGELISGVVGPRDTVARPGGDEYLVCCDEVHDAADLTARAARIQTALLEPFRRQSEEITISASIGMALSTPGLDAEVLLRDADAAMYAAKEVGETGVALFDDSLYAEVLRRHRLTADIDRGLDTGQFQTHFQPEVALATGTLTGFEALARWEHPELGRVAPLEFIELAERSGSIRELGRKVLADACAALALWLDTSPEQRLSVAVNVSPFQLVDLDFPDDVRKAIETACVPPGRICLEVTESALMDSDVAVEALRRLKAIGVTIAIDDFGTGYSSLSRLKGCPVDLLKIDGSFVAGLGTDPEDEVIVAAVVNLGRSLGLGVVAEGVETADQLDMLALFGCELGQGYLWSPALDAAGAAAYASETGPRQHGRSAPHDRPPDLQRRFVTPLEATSSATTLVHELATPLTVIRGYAELARHLPVADPDTDDMLNTALRAIERAADDMVTIVATLDDARTMEEGTITLDRRPVDIVQLLSELLAELAMGPAGSPVSMDTSSPIQVFVDATRCRQIFTNLLSNAEKWSPDGAPIEVRIQTERTNVSISIIDRGPGVAADRTGDLFRKFSRLDRTCLGTGLGLYLARNLARAQGGDIRYRRAHTGGAEFVVELPRPAPTVSTDRPDRARAVRIRRR